MLAQEIEIAAAVGLQDLAAVEPGIAALGYRRGRGLAAPQLLGRMVGELATDPGSQLVRQQRSDGLVS